MVNAVEADAEYFEKQVLPILREQCYECHSHATGESNGQLMLDSLAAMTNGGTRGPSLIASEPSKSLIYQAVLYETNDLQMPPDGKLPDEQIAVLEKWIRDGAQVPESMLGALESNAKPSSSDLVATHWAYQRPQAWSSPREVAEGFPNEIDQIIVTKLAEQNLTLSAASDRSTMLRRLQYDLVGLPPTASEMVAFETDTRSDDELYKSTVDQLLTSPHFGERWARYWMDVARYADTKGYVFQEDREYPEAFRYRDWLIDALNRDMPYDEFVTKQLAADIVSPDGDNTDLPALGFLTLGRRFLNNKNDIIDDRIDVVARGLMGMTLGCARCHDHKYDPVTQADYYSMYGVFLNTQEPGGEPWPHRLAESDQEHPAFILIRGSPGNRGDRVDRRFVSFLDPEKQTLGPGSGRAELAKKIVSADNPLTARVLANRIWIRMTGASLVESPSDLGIRCPPPAQLELLDHLATYLVNNNWSIKSLIRHIATSQTYQQQSALRTECVAVDPENTLYWRMNRRRLDFEALRDTLLQSAGVLDLQFHGKSERIDGDNPTKRRTVYAYIDRQNLPSVFRTFDFASPDSHNSGRPQTSVPQQGLFLLNSDFITGLAEKLAAQSENAAGTGDDQARIQWLFQQTLARPASVDESQLALEFLQSSIVSNSEANPEWWQCGYGHFLPDEGRLDQYALLPYFGQGRWSGGPQLPDDQIGWCMLNAEGGHPGNDLNHAAVRRWIAPRNGRVAVGGKLKHSNELGDGVRGSILVAGVLNSQWSAHNQETSARANNIEVREGQAIDFVVDCISNPSHDSFHWKVRVNYLDGAKESFAADRQFPTPRPEALGRWAQLAQALMLANEVAFID